ncbi:MAG: DUF1800 family protein [Chloracidobacterium sp.]|nr:DUF1800 family protein [Chloracidobacterium sp.]
MFRLPFATRTRCTNRRRGFSGGLYSDFQLRHRVVWALNQIWVTSGVDVQQGRHMVEYHKVLSKNAFGNFRNLTKE